MRVTRMTLIALGAAGVAYGIWLLVTTQRPEQVLAVLVWLAGAIVVHDFVFVPLITFAQRATRALRTRDGRDDPSARH